jgi:nitrogen-specific signal transduction histidine kinase
MALVSRTMAARLTRPIDRLRQQVSRIAEGKFVPVGVPPRDDEIRDLAISVNRMANMLSRYEEDLRHHEQLRTLDRLGGAIAHQVRNAVTGCRMAVDLHRRECERDEDEELDLACRQLDLIERYLQRFLTLPRRRGRVSSEIDLSQLVDRTLPLVRSKAVHLGVRLEWEPPAGGVRVMGDPDALSQVIVNLVLNAIEATTQGPPANGQPRPPREVRVRLGRDESSDFARLEIQDTGPGPASEVRDRLFEPLVSQKPDGVGLGLSIAREIVQQHGGTIHWDRQDERTCFTVRLPCKANGE